jgi:hypothetical protein
MLATPLLAGSWEGDVHVGVYLPQSDILEDADPGLAPGFTLGYRFNPNIAASFGLEFTKIDVPVYIGQTELEAPLSIYPITLDLKLSKKIGDDVEAFIYGGPGLYYTIWGGDFDDEEDTVLGYQIGLGASYKGWGMAVKYMFAEPTLDEVDVELNGVIVTLGYYFH